ncbi:MAG: hypothetical protein ACRESP_04260, partial [Pseudomonas sp.]
VLACAAWFVAKLLQGRRQRQQELESAQSAARRAMAEFKAVYTAFTLDQTIEARRVSTSIKVNQLETELDEEALEGLTKQAEATSAARDAVYTTYIGLATDDRLEKEQPLSPDQLAELDAQYVAATDAIEVAIAQQEALQTLVAKLEEAIRLAPTMLQQLQRDLVTVTSRHADLATKGFHDLPDIDLADLKARIAEIGQLVEANKVGQAVDEIAMASALRDDITAILAERVKTRDKLNARYGELLDQLAELDVSAGAARIRLDGLSARFGTEQCVNCGQQLRLVQHLIEEADAGLELAHSAISIKSQDWSGASSHLTSTADKITELRQALREFDLRAKQVDDLPRHTAEMLDDAKDHITTEISGLRLLRGDTGVCRLELTALLESLSPLRSELTQTRPDYAAIRRNTVEIVEQAHAIGSRAEQAHNTIVEAEAAERRALEARRRAELEHQQALAREAQDAERRRRAPRISVPRSGGSSVPRSTGTTPGANRLSRGAGSSAIRPGGNRRSRG